LEPDTSLEKIVRSLDDYTDDGKQTSVIIQNKVHALWKEQLGKPTNEWF
jgi:hypothetical protein